MGLGHNGTGTQGTWIQWDWNTRDWDIRRLVVVRSGTGTQRVWDTRDLDIMGLNTRDWDTREWDIRVLVHINIRGLEQISRDSCHQCLPLCPSPMMVSRPHGNVFLKMGQVVVHNWTGTLRDAPTPPLTSLHTRIIYYTQRKFFFCTPNMCHCSRSHLKDFIRNLNWMATWAGGGRQTTGSLYLKQRKGKGKPKALLNATSTAIRS